MIFVTGGTGLVGARVLLKLSQKGKILRLLKELLLAWMFVNVFSNTINLRIYSKINWCDGDVIDIVSLEMVEGVICFCIVQVLFLSLQMMLKG